MKKILIKIKKIKNKIKKFKKKIKIKRDKINSKLINEFQNLHFSLDSLIFWRDSRHPITGLLAI